jgi:hypothetical protein
MEVSGQLHAPADLPPGKEPSCPLDRIYIYFLRCYAVSCGCWILTFRRTEPPPSSGLCYDAKSVKQMTRRFSLDGSITTISLPLFLVTLADSQKSQGIFTLTDICNIVMKVETYKAQTGLTQCYNCQRFGHIWVHCK